MTVSSSKIHVRDLTQEKKCLRINAGVLHQKLPRVKTYKVYRTLADQDRLGIWWKKRSKRCKEAFDSQKGKLQQLIRRWNETQIIREMQNKATLPNRAVGKLEPPWSWGEQVDTAVSRCRKIPQGNGTLSAPHSWFYTPRETQTGPQGLINHRVFCGSREWGQLRYPEERGSVKSGDHTQQNTVELSEEIIKKSLQQPTSPFCFDISSDHLTPANTVFISLLA